MGLLLFSCSVVSDSLWPHGLLQHTGLPGPSPTPRVCSNSCPLSQWCHPTISSLSSPCPPAFNLMSFRDITVDGITRQKSVKSEKTWTTPSRLEVWHLLVALCWAGWESWAQRKSVSVGDVCCGRGAGERKAPGPVTSLTLAVHENYIVRAF